MDEFEDDSVLEEPYYPETKRVCVGRTRSGREVYSVKRLIVTLPDEEGDAPTCDMSDLSDKSVTDDDDDDDESTLDSFIDDVDELHTEGEYEDTQE